MILAGDIGGTRTRLALCEDGGGVPSVEHVFANRDFADPEAVIACFLEDAGRPRVTSVALAVAGPVLAGHVRMTNLGWVFDEAALSRLLGGARVRLLNDLEAAAHGVLELPQGELRTIAMGEAVLRGNVAVIAAGTGLGEALLAWHDDVPVAIASEGGHADFAPRDTTDVALLEWISRSAGHVSWEHVVSGPGVVRIHDFLRDTGREEEPPELARRLADTPEPSMVITSAGIAGEYPIAVHALEIFARAYGAEAGNLALKGTALGGVFVAGGIAPTLLAGRWRDLFMDAFVAKGRYTELLSRIPVRVALSGKASLVGAAAVAARIGALPSGLRTP
ncbi:MAG: glucokinase [Candidatus Binatia bacterium]